MLKTGIWQPGRNRHARYDRPGAPPAETGRDQLTPMEQRAAAAGQELTWAPLSEVADLCFEGIRDDVFWMSNSTCRRAHTRVRRRRRSLRAQSQIDRSQPEYLIQATNVMTGRKAGAKD